MDKTTSDYHLRSMGADIGTMTGELGRVNQLILIAMRYLNLTFFLTFWGVGVAFAQAGSQATQLKNDIYDGIHEIIVSEYQKLRSSGMSDDRIYVEVIIPAAIEVKDDFNNGVLFQEEVARVAFTIAKIIEAMTDAPDDAQVKLGQIRYLITFYNEFDDVKIKSRFLQLFFNGF